MSENHLSVKSLKLLETQKSRAEQHIHTDDASKLLLTESRGAGTTLEDYLPHKEGCSTHEDVSLPREAQNADFLLSGESDLDQEQMKLQRAILRNLMGR